jgi:BirA family biotin operon repressor/biotin-[acetyl-CoA-carboxylase] ligase
VRCAIKWPNDVWIGGRKAAGILIEGRPREGWAVVGIGINVKTAREEFPPELRETATSLAAETATSLAAETASPVTVEGLLAELLAALQDQLTEGPKAILAAWRERDALVGDRVRWQDGEGVAAGISDQGALVVETATGRAELDAGEVHLLR